MKDIINDYFDYINIEAKFDGKEIFKNIQSLQQQSAKIAKSWSEEINSQWILRDYIAVKMILSSTILLNSVKFANEKNLRIVEPYMVYYSLLNCARAVVITSPFVEWNKHEIFNMTHQKTINLVGDILSNYNRTVGDEIKNFIDWAREYREIFSYKFPANGLSSHHLSIESTIANCKILCEISQLQSKILENSITKNVKGEYKLDWESLNVGYEYGGKNFKLIDFEDGYRLHYITKKQKRPYSLHLTLTEGMSEDFFDSWSPEDDSNSDELFNPDLDTDIIFPIT